MLRKADNTIDKRDDTIREIISTSVLGADWIPQPEEFHNGDEIGFNMGGMKVRAIVSFDKYAVTVQMITPVVSLGCKEVFYRQQSFFRRNKPGSSLFVDDEEGGAATKECLDSAKDLLVGLYSDWMILQSRKDTIRHKLAGFSDFAKEFMESEMVRVSSLKAQILELSRKSGELKRLFNNGEMSQEEYVDRRKPIHSEIVSLMDSSQPRDPFCYMFSDELNECKYTIDKKTLIKSI